MNSAMVQPRAAAAGAITAFLTAGAGLLLALALRALFDWGNGPTIALASVFAVIGCTLGGFRAGLGAPATPLTNGALAGSLAGTVLSVGQRLAAGKGLNLGAVIFVAFVSGSFGIFGGIVATNANRMRAEKARLDALR